MITNTSVGYSAKYVNQKIESLHNDVLTWSPTRVYDLEAVVQYGAHLWISIVSDNVGNIPKEGSEYWVSPMAQFVHEQGRPSATWVINHNRGRKTHFTVVDSAGTVIIANEIVTDNKTVIEFGHATSGVAFSD